MSYRSSRQLRHLAASVQLRERQPTLSNGCAIVLPPDGRVLRPLSRRRAGCAGGSHEGNRRLVVSDPCRRPGKVGGLAQYYNAASTMDFVHDQLATDQRIRVLTVVDTFSRSGLKRRPTSLQDARSNNGERTTTCVHRTYTVDGWVNCFDWLGAAAARSLAPFEEARAFVHALGLTGKKGGWSIVSRVTSVPIFRAPRIRLMPMPLAPPRCGVCSWSLRGGAEKKFAPHQKGRKRENCFRVWVGSWRRKSSMSSSIYRPPNRRADRRHFQRPSHQPRRENISPPNCSPLGAKWENDRRPSCSAFANGLAAGITMRVGILLKATRARIGLCLHN